MTNFESLPTEIRNLIFEKRRDACRDDFLSTQLPFLQRVWRDEDGEDRRGFYKKAKTQWELIRCAYMRGEKTEFDYWFDTRYMREDGYLCHCGEYPNESSWFWQDNGQRIEERGCRVKIRRNPCKSPLERITETIADKTRICVVEAKIAKLFDVMTAYNKKNVDLGKAVHRKFTPMRLAVDLVFPTSRPGARALMSSNNIELPLPVVQGLKLIEDRL